MIKRTLAITAALAVLVAGGAVRADTYPSRPIQVILPFAGGSGSDVIARIMFEKMSEPLGQRFIIENRPAAGGNVGTAAGAKAEPDGYTLLFSAIGPLATNTILFRNLGYDPLTDFEPISAVALLPTIFSISSKLPVKTVKEFIDYAKAQPKPVTYSSPGNGTATHLAGAYFAKVSGVPMTHVPYRATPQLVGDLISGEVPVSFLLLSNIAGPMQAGQVRALGVASKARLAAITDVPTMAEAGVPNFEATAWFALLAPKGTPKPIIDRLNKELNAALADPAIRTRFTAIGAQSAAGTPEELRRFMAAEIVKWREVITAAGITAE